MPSRVDASIAARLLDSPLKYILSDVDGVVVSGPAVIPGAATALRYLREKGKKIRFLSNNASLSRRQLCENLRGRGVEGLTVDEVYNSGYAAALRLQQLLGRPVEGKEHKRLVHGNIFVIGEPGLHEELRGVLAEGFITYGLELHDPEKVGGFDDTTAATAWRKKVLPAPLQPLCVRHRTCDKAGNPKNTDYSIHQNNTDGIERKSGGEENEDNGDGVIVQAGTRNDGGISLADLNVVAVVVGLDRHFSTLKLAYAAMILQGPPRPASDVDGQREAAKTTNDEKVGMGENPLARALFIATNEDPQIPVGSEGVLAPGAGAMVQALATVAARKPDVVCGKPHVDLAAILFAKEKIENPRASCLMIGDRLITDIAFGNAAGCQTMLVLSGVENMNDVDSAEKAQRRELLPDYIADSLACFIPRGWAE